MDSKWSLSDKNLKDQKTKNTCPEFQETLKLAVFSLFQPNDLHIKRINLHSMGGHLIAQEFSINLRESHS
jgi:hypothetical protein